MSVLPPSLNRLIEELSKLPGIGTRSAQRLSFYLLQRKDEDLKSLGDAINNLKINLQYCRKCQNICESEICPICEDPERNNEIMCIVSDPLDVVALEKTSIFRGLYHVLHGIISPLDGIGPDDLKIKELLERVEKGGFSEIILATNPTMEGEATAVYIQQQLKPYELKITRIARGLPVGGDLEYADEVTLMRAMEGRLEY